MRNAEVRKQGIKIAMEMLEKEFQIQNLAIEASVVVWPRVLTNLRMSIGALQIELKWEEKNGTTTRNKMVQSCTRRHHCVKKQLVKNRHTFGWPQEQSLWRPQ
jgi:hypothetical protein